MYLYHAHAVALGGTVERPTQQIIPALASCSLALSGGTSSARESNFDNGLVAFDSAQSDISGSVQTNNGKPVYVTGVTVVINRLNIRNMFVADKVFARVSCQHDPTSASEGTIITTGSHFENLRIAGYPVTLDMDHQFFGDFPTHGDLQTSWKNDKVKKDRITNTLMGCKLGPNPTPPYPSHLQEIYDGFDKQRNATDLKQTVLCSFVKKVNGINGTEIKTWGPIIIVPQFGTIYLGEVICCSGHRRVNMFRLQLGSPDLAGIIGGSGGGNGGGYP